MDSKEQGNLESGNEKWNYPITAPTSFINLIPHRPTAALTQFIYLGGRDNFSKTKTEFSTLYLQFFNYSTWSARINIESNTERMPIYISMPYTTKVNNCNFSLIEFQKNRQM